MKLQNIFRSVFMAIVISLLVHSILFARPPEYRVVPIPAQLGYGRLNDSDVVAGTTWSPIAWMWNKGLVTNLPGLGSGDRWARDINNDRVVVGAVSDSRGLGHACKWQNGILSTFDAPGHLVTWASSINSVGTVVGQAYDTTDTAWPIYPFILTGSVTTLDNLENYEFNAINDGGVIAGTSWSSKTHESGRAFIYDGGTVTFLSDPGSFAEAFAINNSNHVLCEVNHVAFCLWKNGTQVFLESFTNFGGLNDHDVVVGHSSSLGAVIWENGEVRQLDALIDPNLGLHLSNACDINNKGRILCMGSDKMAYLLIPIRAITVRDAKNDTIPNVEFDLIKVANNPPTFTEDMLGSFTTDSLGQLKLTIVAEDTFSVELNTGTKELVVGDSLKIAKHIYTQPAVKHSGVLGTMYSIFLNNAKLDSAGVMSFDTLNSKGTQDIILDHTELRYNLLVSVEWDAEEEYLNGLQSSFRAMSNYLYDVSDGQIRLDTVMIFDDREHWLEADMRIRASNVFEPYGYLFGIQVPDLTKVIEIPRKWFGNQDFSRIETYHQHPLNVAISTDYRGSAHELGHYGLGFDDEYEFAYGQRCGSVDNYGFMDNYHTHGGELSTEMSSSLRYISASCQNTNQYAYRGASCWDFLEAWAQGDYEVDNDTIYVPIIKPDDPERTLPSGYDYFPGPNNDKYTPPDLMDYDVGSLIKFTEPIQHPFAGSLELLIVNPSGQPFPKADVTLLKSITGGGWLTIEQGQTADNGKIWVLGAKFGDQLRTAGSYVILSSSAYKVASAGDKGWLFGQGTIGSSDTLSIKLKTVEGDYPLICRVELGDNTATYKLNILNPFSANPTVDLLPEGDSLYSHTFLSDSGGYSTLITDSLGYAGTFTIWAVDDSGQNFFFNTDYTITQLDTSALIWNLIGPQGGAEVWIDTSNSTLQKGMILSSPYLIIRTGLDSTNVQAGETHSLSVYPPVTLAGNNRIIIRYADSDLDIGNGIKGKESSLKIFHWDESSNQWEKIGGTVDTIQNEVSTAIADLGVYAAFTTELLTDVKDEERGSVIPEKFELKQNYPNPFNPVCNIEYALPKGSHVTLSIYNILGQKVRVLVDEYQSAGYKSIKWDGRDKLGKEVTSGIYFYRIEAEKFTQAKKMVLIR